MVDSELPSAEEPEGAAESPATEPAPQRKVNPFSTPRSVADRVTIYVLRALFFLVCAGLGGEGGTLFSTANDAGSIGMWIGCGVALVLIVLEAFFSKGDIRRVAAIAFGLIMGLVFSAVFQNVVDMITRAVAPEMYTRFNSTLLPYLNSITTCVFCYFGVTLLLATKDDFRFIIPYIEFRKEIKGRLPLILDTSVFVDGRFQALLATTMIDQRLVVPKFVLDELQKLSDSSDRSIRERGRRGLDIVRDVEQTHGIDILDFSLDEGVDVDVGLLQVAAEHEGKVVTTDHNLTKRARVQGVKVLNINDLATALKPIVVPGETMRVTLLRRGDEPGQAVGFLRDGTMVVVEQAADRVGEELSIEVTSALQTSAGKMIFSRIKGSSGGRKTSGGAGKARQRR